MMHAWFVDGPFKGQCEMVSGPIKVTRVQTIRTVDEPAQQLTTYYPWELVLFDQSFWIWSTSDRHPDDLAGADGAAVQAFLFSLLISPQGRTLAREAMEMEQS